MEFEVKDAQGKQVACGRLLLKQSFGPRFMQAFSFHADAPGDYAATFTLGAQAMETARIQQINLLDQLKALPDEALKKEQRLEEGKSGQLTTLTEARKRRDDAIWKGFPPLNIHTLDQNPPAWRKLPEKFAAPAWDFKATMGQAYVSVEGAIAPLDIINIATKEVLPHDKVVAGAPLPGSPTDDGTMNSWFTSPPMAPDSASTGDTSSPSRSKIRR